MSDFYYSKEVPRKIVEGTKSFTTLPIRVHRDDARIRKASQSFRAAWATASTDSKQMVRCIDTPFGHLLSLTTPECHPSMVEMGAKLVDYSFLENDLMDTTKPQPGAPTKNHPETGKDPFQLLSEWFASFNSKHKRLATELMIDLLATEHPRLPQAMDKVQEYWRYRRHAIKPTSWEEFLEYRIRHGGCHFGAEAVCISMQSDLDDEAIDIVKQIGEPLIESTTLTNDYFSYAKEKDEENCLNSVKFLMQHQGMSEETALNAIKAKVIEREQAHNTAFEEWLKGEQQSPELHRLLMASRLAAGGAHFAQATSPRYGHYKPGLSHYSQTSACWLLVLSACVLLAVLLKLYGADVEMGARFVRLSTAIDRGLWPGSESPGGLL